MSRRAQGRRSPVQVVSWEGSRESMSQEESHVTNARNQITSSV